MFWYGMMWIAVSVAVTTAIILTDSVGALWTFLLPASISFSSKEDSKQNK